MEKYSLSSDGTKIHYQETGNGSITLIFVHGWLGNSDWWLHQEKLFADDFKIVRIDLAGHGKSDRSRKIWTSEQYANDIKSVVNQLDANEIVLIGHSMSGAYVVEASLDLPKVKALILVDTLKDLDQDFTPEQAEQMMFSKYRENFKSSVEHLLPQFLFVEETPANTKTQLQKEFLQNNAEFAIDALKPLYEMDLRKIAKSVKILVRAINSDASPTNLENNQKYFSDYHFKTIVGTGHYPMLEKPDEFNTILKQILEELKFS